MMAFTRCLFAPIQIRAGYAAARSNLPIGGLVLPARAYESKLPLEGKEKE
jgi:hypothetical protein